MPYYHPLGASVKTDTDRQFATLRQKRKNNKQPTHKTAHLQIEQADTRPKFAKELFSG